MAIPSAIGRVFELPLLPSAAADEELEKLVFALASFGAVEVSASASDERLRLVSRFANLTAFPPPGLCESLRTIDRSDFGSVKLSEQSFHSHCHTFSAWHGNRVIQASGLSVFPQHQHSATHRFDGRLTVDVQALLWAVLALVRTVGT